MEPNTVEATKAVVVIVNKKSVKLPSHKATGHEIKKEAIAQGVPIKITFSLFVVHGHGETPVRDDEHIEVHHDEKFNAVACDDNS